MLVLDSRISEKDWVQQVERDGHFLEPAKEPAPRKPDDAGPWEPAVQKIVGFQRLGDNWDGYGAEPPSREVLQSAIGLAYCYCEDGVDPPHRVVAGPGGEVVFEWQDPDGTYTEVEIDRPLHAEIMVMEPGKPAKHWTLPSE